MKYESLIRELKQLLDTKPLDLDKADSLYSKIRTEINGVTCEHGIEINRLLYVKYEKDHIKKLKNRASFSFRVSNGGLCYPVSESMKEVFFNDLINNQTRGLFVKLLEYFVSKNDS